MKSSAEKARRRRHAATLPLAAAPAAPASPAAVRRITPAGSLAAAALLALFAVQALYAAARDSVTIDEYIHLPIGLHALHTGDLRQDPINSHVPRMIAALPLLVDRPVFAPPEGTQLWGLGGYFQQANAGRYQDIFVKGRAMIVLLSLAAALVMAKWAFDLYGGGAALVSLALFALSPSLLAHGHLVTLDMAGTLGFLLALYANWRLLEAPSSRRAAWLGVAVGVTNLLKLSGVALAAMIAATWLIRIVAEPRRRLPLRTWAALLATVAAVALLTLNAGYAFDGTFDLLRDATLKPGGKLATLAESFPWLRLPLPRPFVDGVDMVLEVGKGHEPSYFLWGELSADGWWYYHLAAFAVKCPLPLLGAALFALAMWAAGRSRGLRDYAVFVPVLLLFGANTAFNSLYIGERHVLAAYPLLMIGASPWIAAALAKAPWPGAPRGADSRAGFAAAAAASLALLWLAAGTFSVAPRYLQYFNEWGGGAEGGHRVLVDSNIDWGQDLIRLREYMDAGGIDTVSLAYFGRVNPAVYGIRFTPLERGVSRGKAVVSASFLMGRPYFWYLGGRLRWVPSRTYEWLRGHKPVARVGSMFVFDLP
ncbi:MAG: ArnT family glycosyltransferase [Candidatus Binatia bacterium]